MSAGKVASSRGWCQGMRLCDEIVDELDSQSVSEEHLVGMASKERIILLHSTRNAVLVAANPANRSQLLGIVLETGRDMAVVPGACALSHRCLTSPDPGRLATSKCR